MKKLLIIMAILLSLPLFSQPYEKEGRDRNYQIFFGLSADLLMAYQGPYEGEAFEHSIFNPEIKAGIEKENWRLGIYYEINHGLERDYRKGSLALDYKKQFGQFIGYAGVEISQIWRYQNDKKRFKSETIVLNPGINIELQYQIPNTWLYLSLGSNVFRAERSLIADGKQIRWDTMGGLVIKF